MQPQRTSSCAVSSARKRRLKQPVSGIALRPVAQGPLGLETFGDVLRVTEDVRLVRLVVEHVLVLPDAAAAVLGDQLEHTLIAAGGDDAQQVVAKRRMPLRRASGRSAAARAARRPNSPANAPRPG